MRKILLISVLSFGFSFAAHAQTTAPQDKTAESESSETEPGEQPQTADSQPEAEDSAVREPIDIDEYFKNGEENAKKGFSCNMPSEPIA
ncbi:hypothetical protein N9W89_00060 [Hellea sp.]|nr:hypothetical protein [Hellea sp.]